MKLPSQYQAVLSEAAVDFLCACPPTARRKIMRLIRQLAADPSLRSDYQVADNSGRAIEHLLIEHYVFAYWADHATKELRILEIEDAS